MLVNKQIFFSHNVTFYKEDYDFIFKYFHNNYLYHYLCVLFTRKINQFYSHWLFNTWINKICGLWTTFLSPSDVCYSSICFIKRKKLYIAGAEHNINNCNIIQVKVSNFNFIVVILKTWSPETIAKTRPLPIYNLVMQSTLQAVVYISPLLQTFLSKLSHFLFKQNTKTILYIWYWLCIYYTLLVHMFSKI
jgi:hypothetical protein